MKEREKQSEGPAIVDEKLARVLARSAVCRRVPARLQSKLNRAILLRSSGRATVDALAAKYHLQAKYGISPAALRSYARRLEELVRPVLASQLVAAVLGCLPTPQRREVLAGGQVLLLSRLVGCMSDAKTLSPAEMARVATVLTGFARTAPAGRTPAKASAAGVLTGGSRGEVCTTSERPSKLAEAVRSVYGLSWPPPDVKSPATDAARTA